MRARFADADGSSSPGLRFYTTHSLGEKRHLTDEGYLVCEDVPIARIGDQLYAANEIPVRADSRGVIAVSRTDDELFRPETIASFAGKPVVLGHPHNMFVDAKSWHLLARGTVLNPRRGSGEFADCLIADLMLTHPDAIRAVTIDGMREVSCGYDAEYEELSPGKGRQVEILGNHLALVPSGRCGPRCAIGDRAPSQQNHQEQAMKSKWQQFKDGLLTAVGANASAEVKAAIDKGDAEFAEDGGPGNAVHVHVGGTPQRTNDSPTPAGGAVPEYFTQHVEQNNKRFGKLEEMIGGIKSAIEGAATATRTNDAANAALLADLSGEIGRDRAAQAVRTNDSTLLGETMQATVAAAEILAPGIRVPTFDAASSPKATMDAMCGLRRNALEVAYLRPESRVVIDRMLNGTEFIPKNMTCDAARSLFLGVAETQRVQNNANRQNGGQGAVESRTKPKVSSLADLNRVHAEYWGRSAH